jgi:F-type H+-transporting ATPase subunit delta
MFRSALTVASRSASRSLSTSSRACNEMSFTFAAPNAVHYTEANVRQIDVPSFSGSFGILPSHVPALAVLK